LFFESEGIAAMPNCEKKDGCDRDAPVAIREHFSKEAVVVYWSATIFIIVGYLIDILNLSNLPNPALSINIAGLSIVLLFVLLHELKLISRHLSHVCVISICFLSFFVIYLYYGMLGEEVGFIVSRDLVLYTPLLFSVGFVVGRKAMLAISVLPLVGLPTVVFLSGDPKLADSSVFAGTVIPATILGTYFYIRSMERALKENRRQADQIVKQNHELEELNTRNKKLFSIIGHDLRGPIGNIGTLLDCLKEENLTAKEQDEMLRLLKMSADSSFILLQNLLMWALSEQGSLANRKKKVVDLAKLVNEEFALLSVSAKNKEIYVQKEIESNALCSCYPDMISAVVRNLLSNAIKFTPQRGQVTLGMEAVDGMFEITVADTGSGISQGIVEELEHSTRMPSKPGTAGEAGTGLGLPLCKQFVEQNGGSFRIARRPGGGSNFSFSLPSSTPMDAAGTLTKHENIGVVV
jgi:signal transduction histidine kinase